MIERFFYIFPKYFYEVNMVISDEKFSELKRLANAHRQVVVAHLNALVDSDSLNEADDNIETGIRNIIEFIKIIDADNAAVNGNSVADMYVDEKLGELRAAIHAHTTYQPVDLIDRIIAAVKTGTI